MRLCLPTTDDRGHDGTLSDHFGSAPYFTLVDSESGVVDVLPNIHEHHQHGSCEPARGLEGHDVDAVVCLGLGRRALAGLEGAGVRVYATTAHTVQGALEAFGAGRLVPLTKEAACGGGRRLHCH